MISNAGALRWTRRLLASALVVAGVAGGVVACAPEPVRDSSGVPAADQPGGENIAEQLPEETEWGGAESVPEKSTTLPASFPETFPVPEGAIIDDAGERGEGEWFVVFRAENSGAADALWASILANGSFEATETSENVEGGTVASLKAPTLAADAMTIPQPDGTVLVSYSISEG